jgi:hypothetical protein
VPKVVGSHPELKNPDSWERWKGNVKAKKTEKYK